MAAEAVKVEGLSQLMRSLRKVDNEYPKQLKAIGKKAIEPVATAARAKVPRRTGRLGKSIRTLSSGKGAAVATGRASIPYAGPIHFGWRGHNIEPQPFLVDALHDRQPQVLLEWNSMTEKFIASVWETIR